MGQGPEIISTILVVLVWEVQIVFFIGLTNLALPEMVVFNALSYNVVQDGSTVANHTTKVRLEIDCPYNPCLLVQPFQDPQPKGKDMSKSVFVTRHLSHFPFFFFVGIATTALHFLIYPHQPDK